MEIINPILDRLGLQRKAALKAPDLGQHSPYSSLSAFEGWGWNRSRSHIDYLSEIGGLHLNSLAMAVANCTSIRIPEAVPTVVRTNREGDQEADSNHPMAKLIRRPNKHHVWANYAGACSVSWWFGGNIHFNIVRSVTGEPVELWLLPYFLVTPRWPGDKRTPDVEQWADSHGEKLNELDSFLSHYEYRIPNKAPVLYRADDMVHLKRSVNLHDPRNGVGAFEPLYKELLADDKISVFTAAIMTNMGLQVPVISPKEKDVTVTATKAAAMKEGWIRKTTGTNAGEPVIMTEPIDIEKFGFSPNELDLSNLRKAIESRVCAVCQINPAALQLMIGIENGTSYASSEQARQQVYEEVVVPIQSDWAEQFSWQLLTEFEDSKDASFIFDTSNVRVLQEDKDALYKRESEALRNGAQTINEFLQSVGKKPKPDGDIYLIPSMSTPMTAEKLKETAADMTPKPEPQPIDPASLAKFADLERWFEGLEQQMKGFEVRE